MTSRIRFFLAAAAAGALGLPAVGSANGVLVTGSSSSTSQFITSAPLTGGGTLGSPVVRGSSTRGTWSVISRDGRHAFVFHPDSGTSTGRVASYSRDPTTGVVGAQIDSVVVFGWQWGRLSLTPNGRNLFVLSNTGGNNEIDVVDVTADGDLTVSAADRVAPTNSPSSLIVSADGLSAYAGADSGSGGVLQFDVTPAGRLVAKTPASVGTGGNLISAVALTNGGTRLQALYPDFSAPGTITYAVDAATGRLTATGTLPGGSGIGGLGALSLMAGGTTIVGLSSGRVHTWVVGPSGTLGTPSAGVQTGVGNVSPMDIAVVAGAGRIIVSGMDSMGIGASSGAVFGATVTGGQALPGLAQELAFPTTTRYWGVSVGPGTPPVAALSAPGTRPGAAITLDASGSVSSDPAGGPIVRYDWDFGDGTTLADGGATTSHTYSAAGSYTATVTVTNAAGCSTSDGVWVGHTYACAGGASARASAVVTVAESATAAPAASPAPSPTPAAPLAPAARARAAFDAAVERAQAVRTAALAACAARARGGRAVCRAAAARAYARTLALATAVRTRDVALAACAAKSGRIRTACIAAARARYARDRARAVGN